MEILELNQLVAGANTVKENVSGKSSLADRGKASRASHRMSVAEFGVKGPALPELLVIEKRRDNRVVARACPNRGAACWKNALHLQREDAIF